MKVLIIGYGSIGKRHYEILNIFHNITSIDIVTKQNVKFTNSFINLEDIANLENYDYFVISSETVKHYEHLKYICSKVKNKKILVEKPLYDKYYENIITNNEIFIAYNLRFHPIILALKDLLIDKKIYFANIICGQYLPTWRPEQDYRESYSSNINKGGGVLRDLSHELDYANWLFGDINNINYINTKISDLEINSDDIFTAIAVTENKTILNITIDYISKNPVRKIFIHTKNLTIEADIVNNTFICFDKNGNKKIVNIEKVDRNFTYTKMHQAIFRNDLQTLSKFEDGKKVMKIINNIKCKEL